MACSECRVGRGPVSRIGSAPQNEESPGCRPRITMGLMDDASRRMAATALADAERSGIAIESLTATYSAIDVADAYAIQVLNINDRLTAGGVVRGHKVGLTSRAMQQLLGVSEPDYGHL